VETVSLRREPSTRWSKSMARRIASARWVGVIRSASENTACRAASSRSVSRVSRRCLMTSICSIAEALTVERTRSLGICWLSTSSRARAS